MPWRTDGEGEHWSLRVMVTAAELARASASFASDDGVAAVRIRQWMRDVPIEHTFGSPSRRR